MKRIYVAFLRLYPRDYRTLFGAEMVAAFEEAAAAHPGRGWIRFAATELMGLAIGAGAEWIAKLTSDSSIRGRNLPDTLLMRPPGVPRDVFYSGGTWVNAPEEVLEAEQRVELVKARMVAAIAKHEFKSARNLSNQDLAARHELGLLRRKYGLCSPDTSL
jgi:hypothetical protein